MVKNMLLNNRVKLTKTGLQALQLIALVVGLGPLPATANFIETTWTVDAFIGEAWFVDPDTKIGRSQMFNAGYAEGVFYSCDYSGQSMTYTRYDNADFFKNPEFVKFLSLKEDMTANSDKIFVHRVTCNGKADELPRVLYPFVTNETMEKAWYLYEGGVFSFKAQ